MTYADELAKPTLPRIEAMFTTAPPPFAAIAGSCRFMPWKIELRLMSMTFAQLSSG